ncbi:MAG: hypothetical protein KDD44_01970, partial [Bdellovibrionales bacterium]|nr:hypothetical protein [Bdellovibrionales bacterium]
MSRPMLSRHLLALIVAVVSMLGSPGALVAEPDDTPAPDSVSEPPSPEAAPEAPEDEAPPKQDRVLPLDAWVRPEPDRRRLIEEDKRKVEERKRDATQSFIMLEDFVDDDDIETEESVTPSSSVFTRLSR